jgi:hypothetical protein
MHNAQCCTILSHTSSPPPFLAHELVNTFTLTPSNPTSDRCLLNGRHHLPLFPSLSSLLPHQISTLSLVHPLVLALKLPFGAQSFLPLPTASTPQPWDLSGKSNACLYFQDFLRWNEDGVFIGRERRGTWEAGGRAAGARCRSRYCDGKGKGKSCRVVRLLVSFCWIWREGGGIVVMALLDLDGGKSWRGVSNV